MLIVSPERVMVASVYLLYSMAANSFLYIYMGDANVGESGGAVFLQQTTYIVLLTLSQVLSFSDYTIALASMSVCRRRGCAGPDRARPKPLVQADSPRATGARGPLDRDPRRRRPKVCPPPGNKTTLCC